MNEKTKAKALEILDGMRTIANADMMRQIVYISDVVVDPDRIGAVCQGRQACAVGSLWLADYVFLPGVFQDERTDFLRNRHALRAAYNALNEASDAYAKRHDVSPDRYFEAGVEALFESEDEALDGDERRKAMLKVISAAKRKLKAA